MIKLATVAVNEGGTLKAQYTIEFKQGAPKSWDHVFRYHISYPRIMACT